MAPARTDRRRRNRKRLGALVYVLHGKTEHLANLLHGDTSCDGADNRVGVRYVTSLIEERVQPHRIRPFEELDRNGAPLPEDPRHPRTRMLRNHRPPVNADDQQEDNDDDDYNHDRLPPTRRRSRRVRYTPQQADVAREQRIQEELARAAAARKRSSRHGARNSKMAQPQGSQYGPDEANAVSHTVSQHRVPPDNQSHARRRAPPKSFAHVVTRTEKRPPRPLYMTYMHPSEPPSNSPSFHANGRCRDTDESSAKRLKTPVGRAILALEDRGNSSCSKSCSPSGSENLPRGLAKPLTHTMVPGSASHAPGSKRSESQGSPTNADSAGDSESDDDSWLEEDQYNLSSLLSQAKRLPQNLVRNKVNDSQDQGDDQGDLDSSACFTGVYRQTMTTTYVLPHFASPKNKYST